MPYRKIVRCEIDFAALDQAIHVRLVGVADNLLKPVVLHHDDEEVIEMGNPMGIRVAIGQRGTYETSSRKQGSRRLKIPLHFHIRSLSYGYRGNFRLELGIHLSGGDMRGAHRAESTNSREAERFRRPQVTVVGQHYRKKAKLLQRRQSYGRKWKAIQSWKEAPQAPGGTL
jgi:hypothetical protein